MIKFKNIPLFLKQIIPVFLLLLLVVGVLYFGNAKDEKLIQTQRNLVANGIAKASEISSILQDFQTIDGNFYRYLINQSTGNLENGEQKMDDLKKEAISINERFSSLVNELPAEDQAAFIKLQSDFKANVIGSKDDGVYDVAKQMMAVDVSFVLKGIKGYSDVYNNFVKSLKDLQDKIKSDADILAEESQQQARVFQQYTLLGAAAAIIFILFLSVFIIWLVIGSIKEISYATEELAGGNVDINIDKLDRKDELGKIVQSLNKFKISQTEVRRLKEQQERLKEEQEIRRRDDMTKMADQFDAKVSGTIQSLVVASEKLQEASVAMKRYAEQSQDASSTVTTAAQETSRNVTTVSSATEEMNSSAKEISRQVSDVVTKANQASDDANDASVKVDELNTFVENIGEVVTSIRDIAEQTNLLALNATIEAARAGESGKGFAVVADEVKKLANETGIKTSEIEERIIGIQKATRSSVEAVQRIIRNITDIDRASNDTASAVEEQESVIREITRNISEVSDATHDVSSAIGSVQSAAMETNLAAQALGVSANEIAGLSENLERSVYEFLEQIRGDQKASKR